MANHNHSKNGLGLPRSRYSLACYQVAQFLEGRAPATVREIAAGINTNGIRVRSALQFGDLFKLVGQMPAYRWALREGARQLLDQATARELLNRAAAEEGTS